ncbi:MAG: hypothetical protein GTO02_07875 [Candidatus Dadabacteria bacterium]|nr:hypothetical protein [Candidatus Dadabacteria bacterium]
MTDKKILENKIKAFNKKHKLKLDIGSPFGSNKYIFLHKNKSNSIYQDSSLEYLDKIFFKTYSEALKAVELLESFIYHGRLSKKI